MKPERIAQILTEKCRVNRNDSIVLGFSGGADSVSLLHVLVDLGFKPIIAYFNHQLRKSALSEEDFARKMGKKFASKTVIGRGDVFQSAEEENLGVEEAAREHRYRFLRQIAVDNKTKFVAVAHHADDQVETVLMHILRGSGLTGLGGIRHMRKFFENEDTLLIRPLLNVWKWEILEYCKKHDLSFCLDETNADPQYLRNRIRIELMPELETYNSNIRHTLHRLAEIARDDAKFISQAANRQLEDVILESRLNYVKLSRCHFLKLAISLQREIIKKILKENFKLTMDQTFQMVELVRESILEKKSGEPAHINASIKIIVEQDHAFLYIEDRDLLADDDLYLDGVKRDLFAPGVTAINALWEIKCENLKLKEVEHQYKKNADLMTAFLDKKILSDTIYMRKWEAGDRYAPLGMDGHSMKVSDFFINNSLPLRLRSTWPLVFSGRVSFGSPVFNPQNQHAYPKIRMMLSNYLL